MSQSAIEEELLKATGLEQKKKEDRQAYLVRLCRATGKVADKIWSGLSTAAQDWNNAAAENIMGKDQVEDFPDLQEADEEDQALVESKTKPAKANEPRKSAHQPTRRVSACHMIKKIVVKNPAISVADLSAQLQTDGLKVSDVTIATLRSDLRDTLRVLNEMNLGNFTL